MKTALFVSLAVTGALAFPSTVSAQFKAPVDSVSAAMATVIGGYVAPSLEQQYPADDVAHQMFIDGIKKAFEIQSADEVYYQGLMQGMRMKENLSQMRAAGYPIDDNLFVANLVDLLSGKPTGFTAESADAYLNEIQQRRSKADAAIQQAFLDQQAGREGVTTLPSGLLFEVVTEGEGASPVATDTVEVFYTGKLADGTVFDGTSDTPAKLPVNRLIAGFSEGLQLMKPGGTYRLFIPASLGYGDRGAGSDIPGGAALDFTVTLVDIVNQSK